MNENWKPLLGRERLHRKLLELEARRRVYEFVSQKPGIHMRRVARELDLPIGSVEHHLHQLERFGLVTSHQEGRKRSFFAGPPPDAQDLRYLHFLRNPRWRAILLEILENPDLEVSALGQRLQLALSTLSYHLRRLQRAGLLEPIKVGRQRLYQLVDPSRIERLVLVHRATYRGLHRPAAQQDAPAFLPAESENPFIRLLARIPRDLQPAAPSPRVFPRA